MIVAVTPVAYCRVPECKEPITINDIVREKDMKKAPGHVIISYVCPNCGLRDRKVGRRDSWDSTVKTLTSERDRVDAAMILMELDLTLFNTVEELCNLWASYNAPPPIETMRKCNCSTCEGRRNAGS